MSGVAQVATQIARGRDDVRSSSVKGAAVASVRESDRSRLGDVRKPHTAHAGHRASAVDAKRVSTLRCRPHQLETHLAAKWQLTLELVGSKRSGFFLPEQATALAVRIHRLSHPDTVAHVWPDRRLAQAMP